jgi:hypothetical protein
MELGSPWGWKGAPDLQIDGQTVQNENGNNQWRCAALAAPCPCGKKQVSEIRVHERVNDMELGVVQNGQYRRHCDNSRSVSNASDHAWGIGLQGQHCKSFGSNSNLPSGGASVNIQTGDVITIEIDLKSKHKSVRICKGTTILGAWCPIEGMYELTVVVSIHQPRGAFSCTSSDIIIPRSWEPTQPLWLPDTQQSLRQSIASFAPRASAVPKVNVLLVGGPGAGKSSLVNSIYSALEGEMVRLAARGTGAGTITTRFTKYDFEDLAPAVAIWDSAGWTEDTYKHGALNYVLRGHLPDGFELDQRHIDDRSPGFRPSPVAGDYMHVVLIAVPYEELSNESYLARARSGVPRPSRAAAARSPAPRAGARLSRPRASSRLDASRAADQGRSRVGGSGRGSQDPVSLRRDP